MSYSRAFISCYQYGQPVRLDSIAAACKSLIFMGDITYSDGQVGLTGVPFNGDYCDSMLWYPAAAGASCTIAAATTSYGVAGQLPTGAASGIVGGTGYPPSSTFGVRLQSAGVQGGAVGVVTTSAGGAVTAVTVLTPGKGYTNTGGSASFTFYDQPWDVGYTMRRVNQLFSLPEWQWYFANRASLGSEFIIMYDDHDQGSNNCDWSTASAAPGASTAQKILDMHRVVRLGLLQVVQTYADNRPATGTGDIPASLVGAVGSNAVPVAPADFDRWYFYRDCDANGLVVGQDAGAGTPVVREIYLDSVSYKTAVAAADNAAKTLLGATQKAWFKAAKLAAKAAGLQCWVFSGKDLFNADNADGYVSYTTERDELLLFIQTNSIPVVWITGDRHCAHAALTTLTSPASVGSVYEHLSVCPTPFGSIMGQTAPSSVTDTGNTPYPEMLWQHRGRDQCVYGKVTWNSGLNQTEIAVLDNADDTEQFWCAVSAGARVPTPDQIRMLRLA